VKTEPADKVTKEDKPKSSKGWKIASYISFVFIITLLVFQITSGRGSNRSLRNLEKSIAVLPFDNMGSDPEYAHLGGAFQDEIIMELQKIKSFDRVLSRTSTMQYEENMPAIPEIAEELDVNFLVEGSIQKHGDQVRIRVQVIRARQEDHIWANEYNDCWENIFTIQDQIAFDVAHELQTVLSPEEIARIEKRPTTSLEANNLYLKGREEYIRSFYYGENQGSLGKAKAYFLKALEYDPGFAAAYAGLARVYLEENTYRYLVDTTHTDSTLILIDQAISIDDELADAYLVRGDYYRTRGDYQQAIRDIKKAIELNPSYWLAYQILAYLYSDALLEFELAFENLQKALQLQKGYMMESILYDIGHLYRRIGFFEQAGTYYKKVLELNGDTLGYLARLSITELRMGNYPEHLNLEQQVFERDSSLLEHFYMGDAYRYTGQFEQSLYHYKKSLESPTIEVEQMLLNSWHRIGYVYWKNGMEDSAYECFNRQLEICRTAKATNSNYYAAGYASYDLAGIDVFLGDKEEAYKNLTAFSRREKFASWVVPTLKSDPLFDSIRDEAEFQQIARDIEAKYQAEHERVRKWLEENDML
jgi:TolB-like protein/Tfp pilus assembly protein PilF